MTRDEAKVGQRVRSLVGFVAVPKGTEGVIDEDYGTGVTVAWDFPDAPLPSGYDRYDGRPAIVSGILRDGFDKERDLDFLEAVPCEYCGRTGHDGHCGAHRRHDDRL